MKILTPGEDNILNLIPRIYSVDTVTLIEDNTLIEHDVVFVVNALNGYYLNITLSLNGVALDGFFYTLIISFEGVETYRDKCFCTSQDIDSFSINSGVYVEKTSTNNFIVL